MRFQQGVRYCQRKKLSDFHSHLIEMQNITNELEMEYKLMLQKKNFEKKP